MKNPSNPTICIIDRSITYQKILHNCLEALDYRNLHTFSSSEELMDTKIIPDVVVLDQELGNKNLTGLDFLRLYRPRFLNSHFLFLSSNTNIEIAVESIKLGAYDYIVKSKIGIERLITRIDKLINKKKEYRRDRMLYRAALFSLGMVSLIFLVAIFLYNLQVIT